MPVTNWGWQITPEEIQAWTIRNDGDVLVINKPALVVCHPSKQGPWSSLVGACREYLGVERLHMPSRLDRETSGVVIFAKHAAKASELQKAIQMREVRKCYLAVLHGEMQQAVVVDQPIGAHGNSPVYTRRAVQPDGQSSITEFVPISAANGFTLARIAPQTGRMHQIRVHAQWLGFPIVGDKVYGPDDKLYVRFIEQGFTPDMEQQLLLPRQALHASRLDFLTSPVQTFEAPLAADLADFCRKHQLDLP